MLDRILEISGEYNMFPENCNVVCGLSGGADSVCLLLSLMELKEKLGISEISALHVNHCLRGDESDSDENYCRTLCEKFGVPFKAVRCNVKEYSEKFRISTEESARILRYEIFSENSQGKIIATAHNANDNLETVIHNLSRGTALKGLCGIPPVRDNIVRPLLKISRKEIEKFLEERNIPFVTDSTNLSDDYTRNKIRHNVLPLLEQLNSSLIKTSSRTLEVLRLENSFIEEETHKAEFECRKDDCFKGLEKFHKAVRQRCIAEFLSEKNLPYDYKRLEKIDSILLNGGKLNISGDLYFVSDKNTLSFRKISPHNSISEISVPLKIGKNSIFEGFFLDAVLLKSEDLKTQNNINKKFTNYLVDHDKIIGAMILRNRRNGDKIKLAGKNFTSSVKKLINSQISPDEKPFLHFIDDENGTIFAEKIGIADRVKPDKNTLNILQITVYTFPD